MLNNINVKNINYNYTIIDIRNKEKYNTSHIPYSINIEAQTLVDSPNKYLQYKIPYYIYCQYGKTSTRVCIELARKGYNVTNVIGGYEAYLINT
ncbi:MAG: rhodanese-like domain-containing protein [Bacilli bacterium]